MLGVIGVFDSVADHYDIVNDAGFSRAKYNDLSLGVVAIHQGTKV